MKLVVTGCTGYIGTEILKHCIKNAYISHIFALTRKPLPKQLSSHPKITEMLHEDFNTYPAHIIAELKEAGVEGCIWALGGKISDFKNLDEAQRVGISFPIQAAEAFARDLAPALKPAGGSMSKSARKDPRQIPFRFVFVSGWGAEQNQFRTLWVWGDSRRIKGAAEKGLFDVADHSEEVGGVKCFETIALRPAGVVAPGSGVTTLVSEGVGAAIAVDVLAKCAIETALEGGKGKKILENGDCLGSGWAEGNALAF